jgi:hypothetical protein
LGLAVSRPNSGQDHHNERSKTKIKEAKRNTLISSDLSSYAARPSGVIDGNSKKSHFSIDFNRFNDSRLRRRFAR